MWRAPWAVSRLSGRPREADESAQVLYRDDLQEAKAEERRQRHLVVAKRLIALDRSAEQPEQVELVVGVCPQRDAARLALGRVHE